MAAYYKDILSGFINADVSAVNSSLTSRYVADGYFQLLGTQVESWDRSIPLMQDCLRLVLPKIPEARDWGVLLEYPLYRLRRRIDLVLIARDMLFVIELKVGADEIKSADEHQALEYALDLRDFHKASHDLKMQPILCCTRLPAQPGWPRYDSNWQVQEVAVASVSGLADRLFECYKKRETVLGSQLDMDVWDASPYEPVPTIIEAATTIFAGHTVKDISKFSAENLRECSDEVLRLIDEAKVLGRKRLIVLTGVPGAGKTLAGLNITHGGLDSEDTRGEVVYLSGNTPLVLVIREALAKDEKARADRKGEKKTLKEIRHDLQTRIQHINDFLKQYIRSDEVGPPFEGAIVFDEAQRAWNHKQGQDKFDRDASEPELLLEIMGRHKKWAVIVCLVGAGQEINRGEAGMREWGDALTPEMGWEVIAPNIALAGGENMAGTALFPDGIPAELSVQSNDHLLLSVPMRSYRSEGVSKWVNAVLEGRPDEAATIMKDLGAYPITLTRSLPECREWLREQTRGQRRAGLLASTSANRLLAEGLGATLTVEDKNKICHWYLQPCNDYRASNSLEVTANEYTCQGLELDFAGLCWGGDFIRGLESDDWSFRRLRGTSWTHVHNNDIRRFIRNKYRVFLTRAREGMVLFVPQGDLADNTRPPKDYDMLAEYLNYCGVEVI